MSDTVTNSNNGDAPPLRAAQNPSDALWDRNHWHPGPGEATIRMRSNTLNPALTLYSSWFCPFAQRTWIACEESGAKYLWREINPYEVDPAQAGGYTKLSLSLEEKRRLYPDFVDASPRGLVPAIAHPSDGRGGRTVVWESLPAAEYVNAVFGDGSLVPGDPWERAMTQIWCDHCTNRIQKQYYAALMAHDVDQSRQHLEQCFAECRALARAMSSRGPYFWGDRFSLVDVALAPFWQRMIWVGGHYCNLQFPENDREFRRLRKWWKAVAARPSVRATLVCKPRLIASYSDYATNVATSDFAKMMGSGRGKARSPTKKKWRESIRSVRCNQYNVCVAIGVMAVTALVYARRRQS